MADNDKDSIWTTLGKILLSFLSNKAQGKVGAEISIPIAVEKPVEPTIDWTDPLCPITTHFLVGEAITLHAWNRLATEEDGLTDEIKAKIVKTCHMLESIRSILGCGLNIHCIFRSQKYNQEVVKVPAKYIDDVHARGEAADWDALPHYTIEQAKEKIRPKLEELNIRLEAGTTTWLHNDWHQVGPSGREFKA